MTDAALLSKSDHWKYEVEWRAIEYERGFGVYKFPSKALSGVIVGAHTSKLDKLKLHNWIADRVEPLRLYECTPSRTNFTLHIDEIPLEGLRL